MPIFAKLFSSIAAGFVLLLTRMFGAIWGVRIAAAMSIAGIYISCVVYYSAMIVPWLAGGFSTAWGYVLGLLFPPVAGTVMASLATWYGCIVGKRYLSMLTKLAVG